MEALRSSWTDSRIDELNDSVVAMGHRVDELGHRVDELGHRVDELGHRVDELGSRVDELGKRVDGLSARVDTRVALLDQRIAHLDRRVDDLGHRMEVGFAAVGTDLRELAVEFHGFQRTMFNIGGGLIGTMAVGIVSLIVTQI